MEEEAAEQEEKEEGGEEQKCQLHPLLPCSVQAKCATKKSQRVQEHLTRKDLQPGKLFTGHPTVSPEGVICNTDHAFRGDDFHALW